MAALGLGLGLSKHSSYALGSAFDPDYQAYLDYLTTNTITLPTADQQAKQNALVSAIKTTLGDWNRVKSFRLYAGSNADAALVDVKRLVLMSITGTVTYSEALGYKPNGTTGYIDTGFDTKVNYPTSVEQESSSFLLAITENDWSADNQVGTANGRMVLRRQIAAQARPRVFSASEITSPASLTGVGAFVVAASRDDATTSKAHLYNLDSGAYMASTTLSQAITAPASTLLNFLDGALNGSPVTVFSKDAIGVGIMADSISQAEFTAISDAIYTYVS